MTDSKNTPELRFPGFTESWEEKKLGEILEFIKNYSYSRNDEGDGEYFHIHYGDIHSKYSSFIEANTEIPSIKNLGKHIRLETSDIILADASEDYSDLGKAILLKSKNNRKIIAGLHTFALRPKNNKYINPEYFLYYTKTDMYKKYMAKVGTGTSVFGINKKNLELLLIPLSNISEQEKIGSFFSSLDKKLELQKDRLEELKSYKKGMMQRIFDQEIRFKDENGRNYPDWQEKKLGEVLKEKKEMLEKGQGVPHASLTKNGIELKTERYDRDFLVRTEDKKYKVSKLGDICYNPANLKFGVITINKIGTVIFSPIYVTFVVKKETSEKYLSYYLMRWDFINKVRKFEEGTVYERMAVKPVDLLKYKINLPSLAEQEKIASFLSSLDRKIELEEEKLRSYEEFKKGLMQRMFV